MFISRKSCVQIGAGALAALMIQCAGESNRAPAEAPMPPAEEPSPAVRNEEGAAATATASAGADAAPRTPAEAASAEGQPAMQETAALNDGQIAAITASANGAEIEQAKLARSKSKNAKVLQFANMMITQHGDAQKKQDKLNISPIESSASADLVAETNKTLESLKQKTGSDFDQAYIDAQVQAHKLVLDTITGKLLPNAKSPELKAYLEEIKPKVEHHLELAQQTRDALANQNPKTNPSLTNAKASAATQK